MTRYYAFNGDADGLCALQQLRLVEPEAARLITGVKRDIQLLSRVPAHAGDHVTVLDISLDSNREGLLKLLAEGASVRYFDHHSAGDLPHAAHFEPHIDPAADVCTSILVDRHLEGRHRAWAVTGAYGDGLPAVATRMATAAGIAAGARAALEKLGIYLNYNAYGETVGDLFVHPAALAEEMRPFANPVDFVGSSKTYARLAAGYEADMAKARALGFSRQTAGAAVLILPAESWARRVIGVLANELMHRLPGTAIAVACPKTEGGYAISVRVPRGARTGADEFCRQFATGGGRRSAGGVNYLPVPELDNFIRRFEACFG